MILADRTLRSSELETLGSREVIELASSSSDGVHAAEVFRWIDEADSHRLGGLTPMDFFKIEKRSYWLHIRMRLFFAMFSDAQILDRIPSDVDLAGVERIYTSASSGRFWARWCPAAELVLLEETEGSPPGRGGAKEGQKSGAEKLKQARSVVGRKVDGVFFSHTRHNGVVSGRAVDTELDPLLGRVGKSVIRIEYDPLSRRLIKTVRPGPPPAYPFPSLSSNGLLAAYGMKHPLSVMKMRRHKKKLSRRFSSDLRPTFKFERHDPVFQQLLAAEIARLPNSVSLMNSMRNAWEWFLKQAEPDYVFVTGENNSIGRTFVDAGRALGIRTYGIQHGTITQQNIDYRFGPDVREAAPDVFFTWGSDTRDYLIRQSHYDPDHTHAVGQLRSDSVDLTPLPELSEYKSDHDGSRLLVFASQPQENSENRRLAAEALALFCQKNALCCAVKLHPAETDDGLYARCFEDLKISDRMQMVEGNLYGILAAADFVGTCFSTVGMEAMAIGKPLVVFDPLGLDLLGLGDREYVFHVGPASRSFSEWQSDLPRNLEAMGKDMLAMMGPRDGRVAERIMEVMRRDGVSLPE